MVTIVWFRQDLRMHDNPALTEAAKQGAIVPVFIWAPEEEGGWEPGPASRWWLQHSLKELSKELEKKGAPLHIFHGPTIKTLLEVVKQTKACSVVWNLRYEPAAVKRDKEIKEKLHSEGVDSFTYNASLLIEPWEIRTKGGKPFQVFTPFWKALQKEQILSPLKAPHSLVSPRVKTKGFNWKDIGAGTLSFDHAWQPGEAAALLKIKVFTDAAMGTYSHDRDIPASQGVSRMSPHLHFGEISPRQIWATVDSKKGGDVYLREIAWREFAYHFLYHFPETPEKPLKDKFKAFPWSSQYATLELWKQGLTGYPIVDAGMRQLLVTGWMHNRVRMIVASFLTKDLLMPWQEGARWFWETLVDADLANNTLGWQWVSGCGADAAPYFRIFNPVTQGMKFDPKGEYVKRWIPELKRLKAPFIHAPWEMAEDELRAAGIELGTTYPQRVIEHAFGRERALKAFNQIKNR